MKPKRPCSHPGCPKLTNERFCEEHKKEEARRYERYDRNKDSRKRYGKVWKVIRDKYTSSHPFCERCLESGVYTPAEHVHHIKPLSQGGTHDESNLKSLCRACHGKVHTEIGDRWQKRVKEYKTVQNGAREGGLISKNAYINYSASCPYAQN